MGMRTWQVRWFELGTTEVRYYEWASRANCCGRAT